MSKISIIVPVYKVENYLERCVNSLLAQTWHDIEIILVDDGSPDNSGAICDEFAEKDPRVKVVHKENGGLSSARNAGIVVANGEYIGFIDSDDYIKPQMYEKLLDALVNADADMAICNYEYVEETTDAVDEHMRDISPLIDQVLNREQALKKLDTDTSGYSFYVTAWNKLYKRDLFVGCMFQEGKIHEDEFIVHHLFSKCTRIATLAEPLYRYVQRKGSITNNGVNVKLLDGVDALYDRYSFFEKEDMRDLAKSALLAAEWKLRILLKKMPKSAKMKARTSVKLLLGALIKNIRPEIVCLIYTWIKYVMHKDTDTHS